MSAGACGTQREDNGEQHVIRQQLTVNVDLDVDPVALPDDVRGDAAVEARVVSAHSLHPQLSASRNLLGSRLIRHDTDDTHHPLTCSLGTPLPSVWMSLYQLMAGAGLLSTTQSSTSASRPSISGAGAGAEGEIVTFGTTGQGISVLVGLN